MNEFLQQAATEFPLIFSWSLKLGTALLIFVVGWIFSKWANSIVLKGLRKAELDEALARFLASLVQWGVLAFAVIASLAKVGVETTSLAAVLAAAPASPSASRCRVV